MMLTIITTTLIFNKREEILLIKRANKPFRNRWSLPGGKLNKNERLIKSAKREIKEELGFNPSRLVLVNFFEFTKPHHALVVAYQSQYNGAIVPNPKEVSSYAWVNLNNIDCFEPLPPNHRNVINSFKKAAVN